MSVKSINVSATNVEESFEQAGLAWTAEQAPMFNSANGKVIENMKVIYRSDNGNQIGVVGQNYGVIQNTEAFAFFNEICKKNGATIVKVNEYHGGSLIHLEAMVKNLTTEVRKGDEIGFRFNLYNSFDGLHKALVNFSVLRLVCLNGAVSDVKKESIAIKHTKNASARLDEAIRVWSGGAEWYESFIESAKILNQKMVDKKMVDSFLNGLFGDSDSGVNTRKKEMVESLFVSGKGNQGKTAWDLYNGATEYVDHYSKKDAEDRLEFANVGAGHNLKMRAFNLAMGV
jgi:phage/plasmid-like protein (TIGR03299 family)